MDRLLIDLADSLDILESKFKEYHDGLDEREWANFDDKFRGLRRYLNGYVIKIDELVRWD